MKLTDFRDIEKLPIDFEEIVNVLVDRVKEKLPNKWTDFLASNFGMELIDAFAYEAMLMFFEVNASLNEVYLPTAKTQTAVYRLANTIGYYPSGPSQATVTAHFYIKAVHTQNINIPIYTNISGNGVNFYTTENAVIPAGSTYVDVEAKSGSLQTEAFISTGEARHMYKLSLGPVNTIETVIVNNGDSGAGVVYTYSSFIDTTDDDGHYYTTRYDEDFNCYVSFGDGTYGVNPKKGVPFTVIYVTGAGSSDNIAAYGLNSVLDTIYDSNNTAMTVYVTNTQNAVGGSSAETIDEVKNNAPALYRDQSRCVTIQDYIDIVGMYPGVKKVAVVDHTIIDEIGIFGVKICVIPDGSNYINTAFKNALTKYIETKKIFATQFSIIDPTYIAFDVTVNIKINAYNKSSVVSNAVRKVINNYLYWENRDFGGTISKLDLYSKIKEIDGILSISDISIEENSKIKVTADPTVNTNILTIMDNTNTLNASCPISIISKDGSSLITTAKISAYDKTASTITLSKYDSSDDYIITSDSGITTGCSIYPILYVDGNYTYGDKEILIKSYSITTETDANGEYVDSYKIYNLLNMTYLSIYFGDESSDIYHIMYVSGDYIYLDRELEFDISDNTSITVISKQYVPSLASSAAANATNILLTNYPRFSTGAALIRRNNVQYTMTVATLIRGLSNIDYMSSVIDTNNLVRIEKIYTNESNIFVKGTDYMLNDNDRVIVWTNVGLTKISVNDQYSVQYIKKNVSDVETYVKSINGKNIEVYPPIDVALPNGTSFEYTSDTFKMLPYEIATTGTVTINII